MEGVGAVDAAYKKRKRRKKSLPSAL